jgi:phytoene dehydrogenase-like protein
MTSRPVIVIGGGLAGICCARHLHASQVAVLLLEGADALGGRVRTDEFQGFRLDRGFQVLQTAYPEAQRMLDYQRLELHPFEPGAMIRTRGKFVCMSDPWRRPGKAWASMANGIGTLADRWKLARLRQQLVSGPEDSVWQGSDPTTEEYLRNEVGFSQDLVERFFRPWFSGVFFEDRLETSSRFFRFLFRMFALGDVSLPAAGMEAIPQQLSETLPPESVRLESRVESIEGQRVRLVSGETIEGETIVLAVEGPEAARLAGDQLSSPTSLGTTCHYFSAPKSPLEQPLLLLNGDRTGPINNVTVPSDVAPSYAPEGKSLVAVSTQGAEIPETDEASGDVAVRRQLQEWFGSQVDQWELIRSYRIPHALPGQAVPGWKRGSRGPRLADHLYCCGDYCETASINGAMLSGRRAAEAIMANLGARQSGIE